MYFDKRCNQNGPQKQTFWKTLSPFMKTYNQNDSTDVTLLENGLFIRDTREVCDVLNKYFPNTATFSGAQNEEDFSDCIKHIQSNWKKCQSSFKFKTVDTGIVMKKLRKLDVKKATGWDGISTKLVKLAAPKLVTSLTRMINRCISDSIFPDDLKKANLSPIFKAKEMLIKENYRPISILPILSKIYEGILNDQLQDYFEDILSILLSAFRKRYRCQAILLKVVEDWKKALDNHQTTGAILIDLSKAFDTIPHKYLLKKLQNYGLSENAVKLISSYLKNCSQRVKIGDVYSEWTDVKCGVPQGSILGPLLFNIFINDVFYVIEHSELYNYADDNTLSKTNDDIDKLVACLESDISHIMAWFKANCMGVNEEKFQCIVFGRESQNLKF
jgi:hypothetical protein